MLATAWVSVVFEGARRQTALNAFCTWQSANASLAASSCAEGCGAVAGVPAAPNRSRVRRSDLRRQRFVQVSSGVTKPNLLLLGVDEVLRLHRVRRVLGDARRVIEVVVRERACHRIHAAVAADAVVQIDAAVTARRAGHVLADAMRLGRDVSCTCLHVAAQVIDQREAEHRAVRAGDEERRGAARVS